MGRLGPLLHPDLHGVLRRRQLDAGDVQRGSRAATGRFGSKRAQYVGFYSSAEFWIDHRSDILDDQLEIFRRGVTERARANCCDNPDLVADRGFTEDQHNWMVPYPRRS